MIIDNLEIEGFKSYRDKTILRNFGKNFNAITGQNGSGKSNILDSICFVLGLSNTNIIRASKIQELIYSDGNLTSNGAKITLSLKSVGTDKKNKNFNKFVILSRQIFKGGKNRYFLNGLNISPSKVLNLLYSINLNINNPHFFVRQGHISNVAFMSNFELFDLFECSTGTKLYEIKKKIAVKTIIKKNEKLGYINRILDKSIKPLTQKFNTFWKKYKKKEFFQGKKTLIGILKYKLKILVLNEEKLKFKTKKLKFLKNIHLNLTYLDHYYYKTNKDIRNTKRDKTRQKQVKILHLLKFKNIFFLKMKAIFKLALSTKPFYNIERTIFIFNDFPLIKNKETEKLYFGGKIFFNKLYYKKISFFRKKKNLEEKNLKEIINDFPKNIDFWEFILFVTKCQLTHFSEINFVIIKKTINYGLKTFFNIFCLRFNISYGCTFFLTYLSSILFVKKISFLKEDLTNFSQCFDIFFQENNQKIWKRRRVFLGIISNLIQPKIPNLTCVFEFTLSHRTTTILIKNKLNVNKTIKFISTMNKIDIILIKNDFKNVHDEKYNPFVFRIISFITHSKIFSKITSLFKTCYILHDFTKFKKILTIFLPKGYSLTTSFGEVFHPAYKVFFCGSFCLTFNFIFDKIHLHTYILRWIRLFSICKKKVILKNFIKNFFLIKTKIQLSKKPCWIREKKFFMEKIANNQSNYQNYFLYKIRKNKITKERIIFLYNIKNLNPKKSRFNKNVIRTYKKIVLNFQIIIYKKLKHNVNKFKKIESEVFLIFWFDILKFSFLFLAIQRVITIFPIIYNFNAGTKFKNLNNLTHLKCYWLKRFNQSRVMIRPFSQFVNHFKKKFTCSSNGFEKISRKFEKPLDITHFKNIRSKYNVFLLKRIKVEKDRLSIEEIISRLNLKKKEIMFLAFQRINASLKIIFRALVPICSTNILTMKNKNGDWVGIKFKVFVNSIQKEPNELSGGQKSILALSFIFSLLLFRHAPFYILDEIDAALDFCYTKNISQLILQNFSFAQFVIVSLKKQIILDAEVVFEVKQNLGNSCIMRMEKNY